MSALLPLVDPAKSYLVSGETLNALITAANQLANFSVQYGPALEIVRGDNSMTLIVPPIPQYEQMYGNFLSCDGESCQSASFLIEAGSAGS